MIDTQAYTPAAFCRAYGIGKTTFYAEVKAGRLPIRKIGRRTLVLASDARIWAMSLPNVGRGAGLSVASERDRNKVNGLGRN